MSFAFRRRNLSCFYCGSRSDQKWNGGAQEWRCKACEAINYLDKRGQITDPPAQPSPLPRNLVRYAHPTSPQLLEEETTSEEIFCSTCLKNQHILKETLASYLPPEDAADYGEYLARYDAYREQLEHRYPQVCSQCAPRAREQMRKAAYVAKTDHLRRMIDRTRTSDISRKDDAPLKSLVLRLSGLLFIASALFQAIWHGLILVSLLSEAAHAPASLRGDVPLGEADAEIGVWNVLGEFVTRYVDFHDLTRWMPPALLVSLFTLWWNPRLRAQQLTSGGRLEGLTQYYILQAIVLILRASAFKHPTLPPQLIRGEILRGFHGFMAIFIVSSLVISLRIVRLNNKPLFTFPTQSEPILAHVPQPSAGQDISQAHSRKAQTKESTPFPIQKLAPTPISKQRPFNPPTPPPDDEYDPDSMDWTPSGKPPTLTLNPQQRQQHLQQIPNAFQGPSPFHGTLPPAPMAPSHRLRNPAAHQPGTFRKASEAQQSTFATNMSTPLRRSKRKATNSNAAENPYDSDTTEQTVEDDDMSVPGSAVFPERRRKRDMEMAQPKFFLEEDQRDTGLEDMFGNAFGLQDMPRAMAAEQHQSPQLAQSPGWFGWSRRRSKAL